VRLGIGVGGKAPVVWVWVPVSWLAVFLRESLVGPVSDRFNSPTRALLLGDSLGGCDVQILQDVSVRQE